MKRILLHSVGALAIGLLAVLAPAYAADLFVDPSSTCATPTGAQDCAYVDPAAALKAAKGGDVILLAAGDYPGLTVKGKKPDSAITIRSLTGKTARFEKIAVNDAKSLTFQNLSVWASDPVASGADRVNVTSSADIAFDGLDVRSGADAADYPTWTKQQWADRSMKGFQSRFSTGVSVRNSTFTGFGFAVVLMSPGDVFEGNQIRGFSGDGLRVLGDNSVIKGNLISDCARINDNHPDGIQSWSQDGKPVKGLVLDGNIIRDWSTKPKPGFACDMQGIGFFDGFYDDLTIQNNLIITQTYHGLSIYGPRNAKIINNTVVNSDPANSSPSPWLGIFPHKNGTKAKDVVIANNFAGRYSNVTASAAQNIVVAGNVTAKKADIASVIAAADVITATPWLDGGFVGKADPAYAPATDLRGKPRGATPDAGALQGMCR